MTSNYPPGVSGSEPEIVGYPDDDAAVCPEPGSLYTPATWQDIASGTCCEYCFALLDSFELQHDIPAFTDSAAWAMHAVYHERSCEWVLRRGHPRCSATAS